jgi:hypothetical protein
MNPDPRVRKGAHRTGSAPKATLLPSLLAILAVTSLITALYVWRGEDATQSPAAASSRSKSAPATKVPATTATASPTTQMSTIAPATSATAPATTKTTTPKGAALRSDAAIVVLNETSRAGLAATVAARLRAKGWNVSGVGNFRGAVPTTTVYYPVGHAAAAQAAAESLPTPARIRPRFANLSTKRLTVVVAANYPS